jgi:hypothetical protein
VSAGNIWERYHFRGFIVVGKAVLTQTLKKESVRMWNGIRFRG